MVTKIENILKQIYIELNEWSEPSYSLMNGRAGSAIFKIKYFQYLNINNLSESLQNEIQVLAEESIIIENSTFCLGKAGLNWFFAYLFQNKLLDQDDLNSIIQYDDELAQIAIKELNLGNYDFLHGSIGIAYYLLSVRNHDSTYFDTYFDTLLLLFKNSSSGKAIPYFDYASQKIITNKINLGLSHGLPSILKFCMEAYKKKVCISKAEQISKILISYILENRNSIPFGSYFPNYVNENENELNQFSRLAWCYGDLGVAYILYQAGIVFNLPSVGELAMQVLKDSTLRKEAKSTMVIDASLCHGSSGAAYIYNKLYHLTDELAFKEARDYWLEQTLLYNCFSDTKSGYKMFRANENQYMPENGFLEGNAGIGLTLLSILTSDFSWDYCLMLNE